MHACQISNILQATAHGLRDENVFLFRFPYLCVNCCADVSLNYISKCDMSMFV